MSRKVVIVFVLAFVVLALAMTCGVSFASQKAVKASSALDTANATQLQNGPIKWVVIKKTPKATFDTEYAKVKKLGYTRKSWDTARVAMNTWFKKSKKGQGWILPNTKEKALTDPAGLIVPTEKTPFEIAAINISRLDDGGNTGGTVSGSSYKAFKNALMNEAPGANFKSLTDRGFNFNEVAVAVYKIKMNKGMLIWLPIKGAVHAMSPSTIAVSYQQDPDWKPW